MLMRSTWRVCEVESCIASSWWFWWSFEENSSNLRWFSLKSLIKITISTFSDELYGFLPGNNFAKSKEFDLRTYKSFQLHWAIFPFEGKTETFCLGIFKKELKILKWPIILQSVLLSTHFSFYFNVMSVGADIYNLHRDRTLHANLFLFLFTGLFPASSSRTPALHCLRRSFVGIAIGGGSSAICGNRFLHQKFWFALSLKRPQLSFRPQMLLNEFA